MTNNIWRNFAVDWRDFLAGTTPNQIDDFLASLAPGERRVFFTLGRCGPAQPDCPDERLAGLAADGRAGFWQDMRQRRMGARSGGIGKRQVGRLVGDTAEDVRQMYHLSRLMARWWSLKT